MDLASRRRRSWINAYRRRAVLEALAATMFFAALMFGAYALVTEPLPIVAAEATYSHR